MQIEGAKRGRRREERRERNDLSGRFGVYDGLLHKNTVATVARQEVVSKT